MVRLKLLSLFPHRNMVKPFPKLLFFLIVVFVFPGVSHAQVAKFVFTTEPQSIKPGELSGPITIQAQDSGGNAFQTPETVDLQFVSTSATGEFLGSTGNPATTYMSKNTANRTFYYKDSNEGVFTITVNTRGRDSGAELDVSQQITVSSGASSATDLSTSGEVSDSSSSSSSGETSSSGSSTNNVSSPNSQLEVVAGIDRVTSPGSPIWFQATTKKNTTSASLDFDWSFGDGNVGVGSLVSHTYKFPGDYVVVLSVKAGDIFSVSRLKVKAAESNLSVKDKGEYLEISNNGNTETNLFNWKVENKGKGFIFQPNTIILPKSSVKFDKSLLSMKGLDNSLGVSLKNSTGQEVFSIAPVKEINLREISTNLDNITKEFSVIQEKAKSFGFNSKVSDLGAEIKSYQANVLSAVSTNEGEKEPATTSAENIIYEAPKQESFISKLTNFIKRVFSD
jgi:hypothetical protein